MKIPIFPGKYHQNGGFSMAMFVSGRVYIMMLRPPNKVIFQTPFFHGHFGVKTQNDAKSAQQL